jgi:hypothetical protein
MVDPTRPQFQCRKLLIPDVLLAYEMNEEVN